MTPPRCAVSLASTSAVNRRPKPDTYAINNSVMDVTFADAKGVLLMDKIAGFAGTVTSFLGGDSFVITAARCPTLASATVTR